MAMIRKVKRKGSGFQGPYVETRVYVRSGWPPLVFYPAEQYGLIGQYPAYVRIIAATAMDDEDLVGGEPPSLGTLTIFLESGVQIVVTRAERKQFKRRHDIRQGEIIEADILTELMRVRG